MDINNEFEALQLVDGALSAIDEGARRRILDWVNAKYLGGLPSAPVPVLKSPRSKNGQVDKKRPKPYAPKRSKLTIKQVKDLNLSPKGKPSAKAFVMEKKPSNLKQQVAIAVYYLSSVIELEAVTVDHVYTFFKDVRWPLPANLKNVLHKAAFEGWLDTSKAADLKMTPSGENLVEHFLPESKKENS